MVIHHDPLFTDFWGCQPSKSKGLWGWDWDSFFVLEKCRETADVSLMLGGIHVKKSGGVLNQINCHKVAYTSDDN